MRLDSGDLADLSVRARRILDQNGLKDVAIFASGNLDEYRISELMRAGAPIDAFGVGTAMVVGGDAPSLDAAYKLAEYRGSPRLKTSQGKLSLAWPQAGVSRDQCERRLLCRSDRTRR